MAEQVFTFNISYNEMMKQFLQEVEGATKTRFLEYTRRTVLLAFARRMATSVRQQARAKWGAKSTLAKGVDAKVKQVNLIPSVNVGIFEGPGLDYGHTQEYGTRPWNSDSPIPTIKPKNRKYLAVPAKEGLPDSPRALSERLFVRPLRSGNKGLFRRLPLGQIELLYVLVKRVDIQPQFWLSSAIDKFLEDGSETDKIRSGLLKFFGE